MAGDLAADRAPVCGASHPRAPGLQGVTYYWPTANPRSLNDVASDGAKFRTLLRFDGLHDLLPPGAGVGLATLNLTFLNWDTKTHTLQARGLEAGGRTCAQWRCKGRGPAPRAACCW